MPVPGVRFPSRARRRFFQAVEDDLRIGAQSRNSKPQFYSPQASVGDGFLQKSNLQKQFNCLVHKGPETEMSATAKGYKRESARSLRYFAASYPKIGLGNH